MKTKIGLAALVILLLIIYVVFKPRLFTNNISEKDKLFYKQALVVSGSGDESWKNIGEKVLDLYKKAGFEIDGNSSEWRVWQWVDENAKMNKADEKIWRQCIEKKSNEGRKYCSDQHWIYSEKNSSWELNNIEFGRLDD